MSQYPLSTVGDFTRFPILTISLASSNQIIHTRRWHIVCPIWSFSKRFLHLTVVIDPPSRYQQRPLYSAADTELNRCFRSNRLKVNRDGIPPPLSLAVVSVTITMRLCLKWRCIAQAAQRKMVEHIRIFGRAYCSICDHPNEFRLFIDARFHASSR